jgi:hypothetical protein
MVEFAAKVAAATTFEEMQNVINESVSEIGLMEFMRLDHGAILAKAGVDCDPKSVRVIMGNPLIMQANSGTTARTIWLSAKFCAAMSCRRGS